MVPLAIRFLILTTHFQLMFEQPACMLLHHIIYQLIDRVCKIKKYDVACMHSTHVGQTLTGTSLKVQTQSTLMISYS